MGGWVGWIEEDEAVLMSYCELEVGGWVDKAVEGGWEASLVHEAEEGESAGQLERCVLSRWVGGGGGEGLNELLSVGVGWVGGWVGGGKGRGGSSYIGGWVGGWVGESSIYLSRWVGGWVGGLTLSCCDNGEVKGG